MQDDPKVCELFDARTTYLAKCQEASLQFDTLRRAKHSSMMTLFHLHNPDHNAVPSTCQGCSCEIVPGTGWKCSSCPEFEICANCYQAGRGAAHPHQPLVVRRPCCLAWSHAHLSWSGPGQIDACCAAPRAAVHWLSPLRLRRRCPVSFACVCDNSFSHATC